MSKGLSITVSRNKVRQLIAAAELICYPMGSFYSSLVANLLPRGVSRAIRANHCPKVYIPSTGRDPEVVSGGVAFQVAELLRHLRGGHAEVTASELLHYVLVDSARGSIPTEFTGMPSKPWGSRLWTFPWPESLPASGWTPRLWPRYWLPWSDPEAGVYKKSRDGPRRRARRPCKYETTNMTKGA